MSTRSAHRTCIPAAVAFGALVGMTAMPLTSPAPATAAASAEAGSEMPASPTYELDSTSLSADEFAADDGGLTVSGSGFPGGTHSVIVEPADGGEPMTFATKVLENDGVLEETLVAQQDPSELAGEYTLRIEGQDGSTLGDTTSFTVTEGEGGTTPGDPAPGEGQAIENPASISVDDLMVEAGQEDSAQDRGFDVTIPDMPTGEDVHVAFIGPDGREANPSEFRVELGDDGTGTAHIYQTYSEQYDAEALAGVHTIELRDGDTVLGDSTIEVTADGAGGEDGAGDAVLDHEDSIDVESFLVEQGQDAEQTDRGLVVSMSGLAPDVEHELTVGRAGESGVTPDSYTFTSDANGEATVRVYQEYVEDYNAAELTGEYSLDLLAAGAPVAASGFEVTEGGGASADDDAAEPGDEAGDDAAGDDATGSDEEQAGGSLPQTGTGLAALAAAAALLTIGGVTVAVTMRRRTAGQGPADL